MKKNIIDYYAVNDIYVGNLNKKIKLVKLEEYIKNMA